MFIGGLLGVRNNGKGRQDCFQVVSTSGFVRFARAFYAMPKLGYGNRRNLEQIIRPRRHPCGEIKKTLLPSDDDVGVENYRHLSAGGVRDLRAEWTSRRQALACSFDNAASDNTWASSRPMQTFSRSGTKRATGEPFLSSTKVTF